MELGVFIHKWWYQERTGGIRKSFRRGLLKGLVCISHFKTKALVGYTGTTLGTLHMALHIGIKPNL